MKVALVLAGSYWYSPYVKIYEDILDYKSIRYDIISWDRDELNGDDIISFKLSSKQTHNRFKKIFDYIKYTSFLKKKILENKYDKLIVFGPQIGLLLYPFLKKHYFKRFFLDYRDVSIEQVFKNRFTKLLMCSSNIAISSPGFKKVLPKEFNYLISHNFRVNVLKSMDSTINEIERPFIKNKLVISTIGAIRDLKANMELISALKNNSLFQIKFIGKGSEAIAKLAVDVHNVETLGFYNKDEESDFIVNSDFLNIYYPDIITHSTALSNRFYNALIYKRPMIVTANSIQGKYVEDYNLGLSVVNCINIDKSIKQYVENFSFVEFSRQCELLLNIFIEDNKIFEEELLIFLNK
jgi:hypothetical protein